MAGAPDGFVVERATDFAFTENKASVTLPGPTLTSHLMPLPTPGTRWFMRVFAYNAAGMSPASNTVEATTTAAAGAPAAPTAFVTTGTTSTTATFTWDDNATNEDGVDIIRSSTSAFTAPDTQVFRFPGVNQTGLTMSAPTGLTYYYKVRAYNESGAVTYGSSTYGSGTYGDMSGVGLSEWSNVAVATTTGDPPPPPVPLPDPGSTIRERPPLRLHWESIAPNGKRHRWGTDEPDPANVPTGGRHSSTMPGGHESADCVLPRRPGVDYSDLQRLSTLKVVGAGGDVAGEFRLERAPKSSGDKMAITPSAVGWQAHLEDNKSVAVVYADIDLSRWRAASGERQRILRESGFIPFDGQVRSEDNSGDPALTFDITNEWYASWRPTCESWYDAGAGARVSALAFQPGWEGFVDTGDSEWAFAAFSTKTDGLGPYHSSADYFPSESAQFYSFPAARFAGLQWRHYTTVWPKGGAGATLSAIARKVAVYGSHGLPGKTPPGGGNPGFWASDIVSHAVRTFAPLLKTTPTSIQPSSFVIEHLAFHDPTTAAEIVRQANRFHLRDWAVWNDREFFYHQRGARGRKWRARIAPAQLEETGPQVDRVWESVMVSYRDVDGSTRTVGPRGSGADTETSVLKDTDPANPANRVGATRRDVLQLGTATVASATEVGRRFLEQTKLLDSSGRAIFVGHQEDDRGVLHPYWRVRAGDSVTFVDSSDKSYRRIVKADHNHQARTCSVDLDAPPEGLEALLERLGATLVPLGVT